jgi:hypothetical protein
MNADANIDLRHISALFTRRQYPLKDIYKKQQS